VGHLAWTVDASGNVYMTDTSNQEIKDWSAARGTKNR
jgi:hypothetical protein